MRLSKWVETQKGFMAELQKGESPYTRLKAEKDALEAQMSAMYEEMQALKATRVAEPTPVATSDPTMAEDYDDRQEMVEVTYGRGAITPDNTMCVYKKLVPKEQALKELVRSYINRKPIERIIPREDFEARKINQATCYIKFAKRDFNGDVLHSYRDLPLWLAAERIVNHPRYTIELVKKSEYEKWLKGEQDKERQWQKPLTQGQVNKAIKTLADQADMINQ